MKLIFILWQQKMDCNFWREKKKGSQQHSAFSQCQIRISTFNWWYFRHLIKKNHEIQLLSGKKIFTKILLYKITGFILKGRGAHIKKKNIKFCHYSLFLIVLTAWGWDSIFNLSSFANCLSCCLYGSSESSVVLTWHCNWL